MVSLTPAFIVLAVALIASIEAVPIINSPTTLVQCQPAALTWSSATPPVYISAVEGTSTASVPLITFAPQNQAEGSLTWEHVNITQGTTITLIINDGKGVNNFSGQVTVKPGSDDCNPSVGSGSSSATTAATAPTTGTSATSGTSGTSGTTSGTSSGSSGGSSSSNSGTSGSDTSSGHSSSSGSGSSSSTTATPSTAHNTSSTGTSSTANTANTAASNKSSTSTTSGSAGMVSSANTLIAGTFALVAGSLIATGLF